MVCDEIGHAVVACLSLPAMDPIPSSFPVSDSSDSDVESGGEPPSSEGLASQGMLVPLQSTQIVRCMRCSMSLQPYL